MTGVMAGVRAAERKRGEALAPGRVAEGQPEGFADRLQTGAEKRATRGSAGVGLSQGSRAATVGVRGAGSRGLVGLGHELYIR